MSISLLTYTFSQVDSQTAGNNYEPRAATPAPEASEPTPEGRDDTLTRESENGQPFFVFKAIVNETAGATPEGQEVEREEHDPPLMNETKAALAYNKLFTDESSLVEAGEKEIFEMPLPENRSSGPEPELATQIDAFPGINSASSRGGGNPSDSTGAAGTNHILQMVNQAGAIYTKDGRPVKDFALFSFFRTAGDRITDPRVIYDPSSERWFTVLQDITLKSQLVAVSKTDNPTGEWNVYKFPFTNCPDQARIGVSKDKFVISVNGFSAGCSSPYKGAQYTVVNKTQMIDGKENPDFNQSTSDMDLFALQPAINNPSNSTSSIFMLSIETFGTHEMNLVVLDGPISHLTLKEKVYQIQPTTVPPKAEQKASTIQLKTGDGRAQASAWSHGKLWFTFVDGCQPDGDTSIRSCVRILQIDTNTIDNPGEIIPAQDFDVAIPQSYLLYPALATDSQGNMGILMGLSSSQKHPSLLITGQTMNDPINTVDDPQYLVEGTAVSNAERYGDYQTVSPDPVKDSQFWNFGQISISTGPSRTMWSSYIGTFTLQDISSPP